MLSHRRERASSFIRDEVTNLLRGAVHDPRVDSLTVTDVELTKDRRLARVYVASYTGEEDLQAGLAGLESAKGFLRRELAKLLHWRFTPELEFRVDRSWEYGNKIDAILNSLDEATETDEVDEDEQSTGDSEDSA